MRPRNLTWVLAAMALSGLLVSAPAPADVPPDYPDFSDYRATWTGTWSTFDPNNLGVPTWEGDMDLVVPNLIQPDKVKRAWVEVDYDGPVPDDPPLITLSDPPAGVTAIPPHANLALNGYTYGWVIDPQPPEERVTFPTPEFRFVASGPVGSVTVATVCRDRTQTYNIQKPVNQYGNLNQNIIPNIGAWACGPTAATNSLVYLQNAYAGHYGNALVPASGLDRDGDGDSDFTDDMIVVAETLADANHMNLAVGTGVYDDMFIYGKHKYMEEVAPGLSIYGAQLQATWGWPGVPPRPVTPPIAKPDWVEDNTAPTWEFIYDNLVACEDVEILVYNDTYEWGHFLTITSFTWVDADGDGFIDQQENATIDYIDPCGGVQKVSLIREITVPDPSGPYDQLQIWYNHATHGQISANVIMAMHQSVPEPATMSLLSIGVLIVLRRRRRA